MSICIQTRISVILFTPSTIRNEVIGETPTRHPEKGLDKMVVSLGQGRKHSFPKYRFQKLEEYGGQQLDNLIT